MLKSPQKLLVVGYRSLIPVGCFPLPQRGSDAPEVRSMLPRGVLLAGVLLALAAAAGCGHRSSASPSPRGPEASRPADPGSEQLPAVKPGGSQQPVEHPSGVAEPAASAPPRQRESASPPPAVAENDQVDDSSRPPAAEPSKPKPPPADRTPRRPGDAEKITFEDLNLGMPADVVFRPFMLSERVNELADKRVSIVGYMHPPESQRGITKFILLKNTQCKFGPGGQADHLCDVRLGDGLTTSFTNGPIKVEGTLRIEPFQGPDGNTWSVFRLDDAQIR